MARFNKGIFGPITGKLGPVIGSSWKGVPYLKIASANAPKERVQSEAQLAHHQKFRFLTKWLKPLHPYLLVGYRNMAQHTTEINAAFSYNFKQALKVSPAGPYIDYENTLQLTWKNTNGSLSVYNDQLMLVLYNDEIGFADGFTGGIKRSAKACTFTFDKRLVGTRFPVFVGLIGLNGHEISESQYLDAHSYNMDKIISFP
ncbi:MAG: DUF6266 family protein [Bacteroidota bacterium]